MSCFILFTVQQTTQTPIIIYRNTVSPSSLNSSSSGLGHWVLLGLLWSHFLSYCTIYFQLFVLILDIQQKLIFLTFF